VRPLTQERILVFSDIHGRATDAAAALAAAQYNPDRDRLIFLGDMIDRGPESAQAVQWLRGLQNQGAVVLMGNHEWMLLHYLQDPAGAAYYLYPGNGGTATLESYGGAPGRIPVQLIRDAEWMAQLPLFHVERGYLFVHAGIDPTRPLTEQRLQDVLWIREGWLFSARPHGHPVIVVYGHTPVQLWVREYLTQVGDQERLQAWYAQMNRPGGGLVFREPDRICVDTGAATGLPGTVTVYDLTGDVQYCV